MSAVKMTRNNFGELLEPGHKKIFFEAYNEKPCQYKNVFKTDKMTKAQETYPHLGALGMWQPGTEGQVFNKMDFAEGAKATFVAQRYDNAYQVTWELMQDDQYSVFRGKGVNGDAKGLGKGLRTREETNAANVIINGFTVPGYDGVPLFSENHPLINSVGTCSNLIEGALTDENLKKALTKMRLQKDEAGQLIAARATQLVVCPELEFTARTLVESLQTAGTNNNDKNTLPRLEVVVLDYLQNDNTLIWFVQDKTFDNLMFLVREEAIFRSERIPDTMDWQFEGYKRFAEGYVDWRGLVGSTGIENPIIIDTYTVTFNSNGGSSVANQSVISGSTATVPTDPTYAGKVFAGWYSDALLTTIFDFSTPITANTTVYAKWYTYTLTSDVTVDNTKTYYTYDSTTGEYTVVANPVDADIATYYERT